MQKPDEPSAHSPHGRLTAQQAIVEVIIQRVKGPKSDNVSVDLA